MLHAIIKHKMAVKIEEDYMVQFKEDSLTAGIFSRLMYLKEPLLWKILLESACPKNILPESVEEGDLNYESSEFWPRWPLKNDSKNIQTHREPDLFLCFKSFDLIIEAKISEEKIAQYAEQLADEWIAYYQTGNHRNSAYLVAVGGLGDAIEDNTKTLQNGIDSRIKDKGCPARILVGISWRGLYKTIHKIIIETEELKGCEKAILKDICQVFDLHGISYREPEYFFDFAAQTEKFRNIRSESLYFFSAISEK